MANNVGINTGIDALCATDQLADGSHGNEGGPLGPASQTDELYAAATEADVAVLRAEREAERSQAILTARSGAVGGPGGPVTQPVPEGGNTNSLDPDKTHVPNVPEDVDANRPR